MVAIMILVIIFIIIPVLLIFGCLNSKSEITKAISWCLMAIVIAFLGIRPWMFEELPEFLDSVLDVNGITGPLGLLFGGPLLMGMMIVILSIFFCIIMALRAIWRYINAVDKMENDE